MKDTSNAYVPTIYPFQRRAHITSLRRTSVRSLVCDDCWAGPYKYESFRKLVSGEDVLYHTTWNRVQRATAAGCGLCLSMTRISSLTTKRMSHSAFDSTNSRHLPPSTIFMP